MSDDSSIYPYHPSHVLPVVFAGLLFISMSIHIYQNFRYRFWRVAYFTFHANIIFLTGWILREVSTYKPSNLGLYIAQTILIYAGPPIFAAAEYNILGRLLFYLPMHASLHPNRVLIVFIYLGALVESLTGAGAGKLAGSAAKPGSSEYLAGGNLIAASTVLQAGVELFYMSMVARIHYRCSKSGMLPKNVKMLCIMLYGTSTLVILRCIFRSVEAFTSFTKNCNGACNSVARHEWYLYVFEAAPMVVFTFWLNFIHPGKYLPADSHRYLDTDGKTERMGPGWIDTRSKFITFMDPFNFMNDPRGRVEFWLSPQQYPVCEDGSFALGTASNVGSKRTITKPENMA